MFVFEVPDRMKEIISMSVPEIDDKEEDKPFFINFTSAIAHYTGRPLTFSMALFLVIIWAATVPYFHYSENWQLVINTGTTIITFLMVFLIQSTQNRDTYAMQLKLDELVRATTGAHTELLDIESLPEERLRELRDLYAELAKKAREKVTRGLQDTDSPPVEIHHRQA
jgi:low affinity Fe/Cu permease